MFSDFSRPAELKNNQNNSAKGVEHFMNNDLPLQKSKSKSPKNVDAIH